ncbi:MAG: RagB/SusD family nutrient uptake outer membrane protein [Mediterranea sp.]|jgi:hypothetical protein|nr:RagB/SusD family nutrient uptake outer membrane protein [Mediterranea sp.]
MKKIIRMAILAALAVPALTVPTSCEDLFEPAIENNKDIPDLPDMPLWAGGLLEHAYLSNPVGSWPFSEAATDDAVSNDPNNGYRQIATGAWSANNNPLSQWQYLRASWQYLNVFLQVSSDIPWAEDQQVDAMFRERMDAEAKGLRAFYMYHLLLNHAGYAGGELLGIPVLTEAETVNTDLSTDIREDYNHPRNTFQECLAQIESDAAVAIASLPNMYGDLANDADVPEKYRSQGIVAGQYNRVFGTPTRNRMSAQIARGVRAQAALLAASPAYSGASGVTWEQAADRMAEVLEAGLGSNPTGSLDPKGITWYASSADNDALAQGENPLEIIWRANKETNSSTLEATHFPPSLYGSGRINPTQNLVDAFPMANGYPITDAASGFDASNPYAGRDPRLDLYILRNGGTAGPQNTVINTSVDDTEKNGIGQIETSTRTGYYLKKHLIQGVNANPSSTSGATHYKAFMRYTEFFLGYAEAANEAWGPTGTGSHSFSAYDVVKAIRQRAKVGVDNGDAYLESIKNDKDRMRELIRNERRLELCFEGIRFWDLRRWKAPLNESARGMRISGTTYTVLPTVEARSYQDYMYYGPIPYTETVKFSNLLQNDGW